jgi:hypothetical protein
MKSFTIPYGTKKKKLSFEVWLGEPNPLAKNPLFYQEQWLWKYYGITLPPEIINSFRELKKISDENNTSFQDLCAYSLSKANSKNTDKFENTSPEIWRYFWCDQLCVGLFELASIASRVCQYLFDSHDLNKQVWGNVADHWLETAREYFYAIMIAAGVQENLFVHKLENWQYFQHLTSQSTGKRKTKTEYTDSFEDENYVISTLLDTKGRFIPVNILGFLSSYITYSHDTTSRVDSIIRDVLLETARKTNLSIPHVPEKHTKAFHLFCKSFAKSYNGKIKHLVKPKKAKTFS